MAEVGLKKNATGLHWVRTRADEQSRWVGSRLAAVSARAPQLVVCGLGEELEEVGWQASHEYEGRGQAFGAGHARHVAQARTPPLAF